MTLTLSQTKNFRHFPNSKSLQTTISNFIKMAESIRNRQKTLWKKEKMLVTSNFSFSQDLYCRHVKTSGSLGKGWTYSVIDQPIHKFNSLNLSQITNFRCFRSLQMTISYLIKMVAKLSKWVENTVEKGYKQFLLSPGCFQKT